MGYYLKHHFNQLGSVMSITDYEGDMVERYEYDVYGSPTIYDKNGEQVEYPSRSPLRNRYMFTGREWDANDVACGLYHYRARAYNHATGRFLQRDPKYILEFYFYAENAPTVFGDPMGEGIKVDVAPGFAPSPKVPEVPTEVTEGTKPGEARDKKIDEYLMKLVKREQPAPWEKAPKTGPEDATTRARGVAKNNPIFPTFPSHLAHALLRITRQKNDLIKELNLYGHGSKAWFNGPPALYKNAVEEMRKRYSWIPCVFDKYAHVWFYSCYTARGKEGEDFLMAVAQSWLSKRGGYVWGYTGNVLYGWPSYSVEVQKGKWEDGSEWTWKTEWVLAEEDK